MKNCHNIIHFCITFLTVTPLFVSCETDDRYLIRLNDAELFNDAMEHLSDVVVYDIFSPPVASRVYVYPTIAAYSIIQKGNRNKYFSLEGQLAGYKNSPDFTDSNVIPNLAALHSFLEVGRALIFSENKVDEYQESLSLEAKGTGVPKKL